MRGWGFWEVQVMVSEVGVSGGTGDGERGDGGSGGTDDGE